VLALHIEEGPLNAKEQRILDDDFKLCERLGIEAKTIKGPVAASIIEFAKSRNVTQLIVGHPDRSRVQEVLRPPILGDLARALKTVDILIVATETPTGEH
jgi:two-component system sensor histidine kinase KdpD